MPSHYQWLGVKNTATTEEINAAFHEWAKLYTEIKAKVKDTEDNANYTKIVTRVWQARNILTDELKCHEYNQQIEQSAYEEDPQDNDLYNQYLRFNERHSILGLSQSVSVQNAHSQELEQLAQSQNLEIERLKRELEKKKEALLVSEQKRAELKKQVSEAQTKIHSFQSQLLTLSQSLEHVKLKTSGQLSSSQSLAEPSSSSSELPVVVTTEPANINEHATVTSAASVNSSYGNKSVKSSELFSSSQPALTDQPKLSAEGLEKVYWIINTCEKKYDELRKVRIQFSTKEAEEKFRKAWYELQPAKADFTLFYNTDTVRDLEINFSCNTYNINNTWLQEAMLTLNSLYKHADISHVTHEFRGTDNEEINAENIPVELWEEQRKWLNDHPGGGRAIKVEASLSSQPAYRP